LPKNLQVIFQQISFGFSVYLKLVFTLFVVFYSVLCQPAL